jgi:hypothetical protein
MSQKDWVETFAFYARLTLLYPLPTLAYPKSRYSQGYTPDITVKSPVRQTLFMVMPCITQIPSSRTRSTS